MTRRKGKYCVVSLTFIKITLISPGVVQVQGMFLKARLLLRKAHDSVEGKAIGLGTGTELKSTHSVCFTQHHGTSVSSFFK